MMSARPRRAPRLLRHLSVGLFTIACIAVLVPVAPLPAAAEDCGDGQPGGKFPVAMVHGFNQKPNDKTWFTAVESTLTSEGATPHFFDYGASSQQWVTDPQIGPRLASTLACLARESKAEGGPGQVGIVAHSMGGLAVRAAFAANGGVLDPASVAFVVSVATPHEGAFFNKALNDYLGPFIAGALVAICVSQTALWFCEQALVTSSPAARAMAQGSNELAQLPWFPARVAVHAVGGEITACHEVLFYTADICGKVNDPLVPLFSSTAHTHPGLDTITRTDCKVADAFLLIDALNSLREIPCSHGALMLTDTTLDTVRAAIEKWKPASCDVDHLAQAVKASEGVDPRTVHLDPPGVIGIKCVGDWAIASIDRPNVGTTDGTTVFHLVANQWTEAFATGPPVVACLLESKGVPHDIATQLLGPIDPDEERQGCETWGLAPKTKPSTPSTTQDSYFRVMTDAVVASGDPKLKGVIADKPADGADTRYATLYRNGTRIGIGRFDYQGTSPSTYTLVWWDTFAAGCARLPGEPYGAQAAVTLGCP